MTKAAAWCTWRDRQHPSCVCCLARSSASQEYPAENDVERRARSRGWMTAAPCPLRTGQVRRARRPDCRARFLCLVRVAAHADQKSSEGRSVGSQTRARTSARSRPRSSSSRRRSTRNTRNSPSARCMGWMRGAGALLRHGGPNPWYTSLERRIIGWDQRRSYHGVKGTGGSDPTICGRRHHLDGATGSWLRKLCRGVGWNSANLAFAPLSRRWRGQMSRRDNAVAR